MNLEQGMKRGDVEEKGDGFFYFKRVMAAESITRMIWIYLQSWVQHDVTTMGAVCEPYVHMLPFDLYARTWGKHVKQLANLDNGEEVAKDLLRL